MSDERQVTSDEQAGDVDRAGTLSGWARPCSSAQFHFFADLHESDPLLSSICSLYFMPVHFVDRSRELDRSREKHARGNCIGCRAWLSIPKNVELLEREGLL